MLRYYILSFSCGYLSGWEKELIRKSLKYIDYVLQCFHDDRHTTWSYSSLSTSPNPHHESSLSDLVTYYRRKIKSNFACVLPERWCIFQYPIAMLKQGYDKVTYFTLLLCDVPGERFSWNSSTQSSIFSHLRTVLHAAVGPLLNVVCQCSYRSASTSFAIHFPIYYLLYDGYVSLEVAKKEFFSVFYFVYLAKLKTEEIQRKYTDEKKKVLHTWTTTTTKSNWERRYWGRIYEASVY